MRLPKTYEQLAELDLHLLYALWENFYGTEVKFAKSIMLRPLWYEIQCKNKSIKLEQKHITKLNKYSKDPEKHLGLCKKKKHHIHPGTELKKTYKGQQYIVQALESDRFLYKDKVYETLSSVAKEISGKSVSGYDFFGLRKKG